MHIENGVNFIGTATGAQYPVYRYTIAVPDPVPKNVGFLVKTVNYWMVF